MCTVCAGVEEDETQWRCCAHRAQEKTEQPDLVPEAEIGGAPEDATERSSSDRGTSPEPEQEYFQ